MGSGQQAHSSQTMSKVLNSVSFSTTTKFFFVLKNTITYFLVFMVLFLHKANVELSCSQGVLLEQYVVRKAALKPQKDEVKQHGMKQRQRTKLGPPQSSKLEWENPDMSLLH